MNLSNWQLCWEFNCSVSLSCLSWNSSRLHPAMIAVGSDDQSTTAGGKVHIYEYNDSARKFVKAETVYEVTDPVHDVRFAPNLGRSYHLLAIAAKDLTIVSLRMNRKDPQSAPGGVNKPEMRLVGHFEDHDSQVWRVSWNITGTVLASSGDDGCVRLWKANYLDSWKCLSVLRPDNGASEAERASMHNPSLATTPTQHSFRLPPAVMNIKRTSGWPTMDTKADQGKVVY